MNQPLSYRDVTQIFFVWSIVCLLETGCSRLPERAARVDDNSSSQLAKTPILQELNKRLSTDKPSNDRRWRPDMRILSAIEFKDERVLIRNVRNCRYRTEEDYDVRHYDLEFNLDDVQSVDFIIVPFSNLPLLAHTMLSFGLRNGQHFNISVEGRMEQGENYSATNGTSNEFELIYVVGDELDLIPLRTAVRKVDVYLYRGRATPDQVQDLLVEMLDRANKLAREPEFYNTITNNCTTNLVDHVNRLRPGAIPRDWRVLFPGHSDKLLYELGLLDVTGSFEEARRNAKINTRVELYRDKPNFSQNIRNRK